MEYQELYRQTYAALRRQTEAELRERAQHLYQTRPEANWRQFVALVEFCWQLSPAQSDYQHRDKIMTWAQYFERVQKLEAWRQRG
jgi:hypothetical protein